MAQSNDVCEENVEAIYEKYKNVGSEVYHEYENLYKQMWSRLNANHLKPFAEVLMKHENIVLKGQHELVETIKYNLEQQMQQAVNNFWHTNCLSEALISLEICKEKFKGYEGHKWNMDGKTPWERTRPIRMRIKETRLRYLKAQLNSQNQQLEEVLQENGVLRQQIKDVTQQRTLLTEAMENFRQKIELTKADIIKLQEKMLTINEENIESNIEAGNNTIQWEYPQQQY